MNIRPATTTDAHAIAEIHVRAWRAAYRGLIPEAFLAELSVERRTLDWRTAIETEETQILVAGDPDCMAGWISFGKCRDSDQPPGTGEIWALYAAPEYWSCGIGRSLWLAARASLLDQGFCRVVLWVLEGNERARRFYQKAGFIEDSCPRKTVEFDGVPLNELRLAAALDPLVSKRQQPL